MPPLTSLDLEGPGGAGAGPGAMRRRRGQKAYLAGALAEEAVARAMTARGCEVLARRWRGKAGEIDLICRQGGCLVFVEVKQAASHDLAAIRLSPRQQARICNAALEYCGAFASGSLTEMRLDVALVDATGRVALIENAFGDSFP